MGGGYISTALGWGLKAGFELVTGKNKVSTRGSVPMAPFVEDDPRNPLVFYGQVRD